MKDANQGNAFLKLSSYETAMERRLHWSRSLCATVLVLGIIVVLGGVVMGTVTRQQQVSATASESDRLPYRPPTKSAGVT